MLQMYIYTYTYSIFINSPSRYDNNILYKYVIYIFILISQYTYICMYIQQRVLPCFLRLVQILYDRIFARSESCSTLWNIGSFVGRVRILCMADNGHRADKRNVILMCAMCECVFQGDNIYISYQTIECDEKSVEFELIIIKNKQKIKKFRPV